MSHNVSKFDKIIFPLFFLSLACIIPLILYMNHSKTDAITSNQGEESIIAQGKARAATCQSCHGTAGISHNPAWPNLAGQKKSYLIQQLQDFKSGERESPIMSPMAKSLTDEEIKLIASYYSSLP